MKTNLLSDLVLVLVIGGISSCFGGIVWYDDFSDGDDTQNPEWIHVDYGTGMNPSWTVVDDGTGDMVYKLRVESDGIKAPKIGSYVAKKCPTGRPNFLTTDPFPEILSLKDKLAKYASAFFNWVDWKFGYCLRLETIKSGDANMIDISLFRVDDDSVETLLASTMVDYVSNQWTTERLMVADGHVRAKVWASSESEPVDWLFDVADNTYSGDSLYCGVAIGTVPENDYVEWVFDDVTMIPEPASLFIFAIGGLALLRKRRT